MKTDPLAIRASVVSIRQAVAAVIAAAAALAVVQPVHAADNDTTLDTVVVTGTLIPIERDVTVPTPVLSISADDLTTKGFTSIADSLQQAVFSTGTTQTGIANSFTPGAKTISMFGLDPSYTKYLVDGRPLGNYPSLYNGSVMVSSISGIPSELIDHIDILPGGQSSIYGSDAIAGVVNIVMKRSLDGPIADAKYGWDADGGGRDLRLALADGASFGNFKVLGGVQYENTQPVWGFSRALTSTYNFKGNDPGIAARDWMLFGYYGDPVTGDTYYHSTAIDPAQCGTVASQFNNSVGVRYRPNGHGYYCGSFNAGQDTYENGESQVQGYFRGSFDVTDHLQVYTNVLLNHDVTSFSAGAGSFQTVAMTSSPWNYYEDPTLVDSTGAANPDYLNLQHIFSPEEAGGLNNTLSQDIVNGERFEVGVKGGIGSSDWTYDGSMNFEQDKLTERIHMQFTTPISNYYSTIMGPNLGVDPVGGDFDYSPNYPAFFSPIAPADYAAFSGYATSYSYTQSTLARGQLTDASLFHLPGGNAAAALVVEGGTEGWNYVPDPRYATGETYLYSSVGGTGHRSRYAGTAELRLPIIKDLSISASGRFDKFNVVGGDFQKFTYNLGAEYHPLELLTLRGRYGTAFKAPTLADEFQGQSGSFTSVTDYYQCSQRGFSGSNLSACPSIYLNDEVPVTTQGNPDLKPTTAKVWDVGLVLTPLPRLTLSSDFMVWSIDNEVTLGQLDQIVRTDSECLLGALDAASSTCLTNEALVSRDNNGVITGVSQVKLNQSNERVTTVLTQLQYALPLGRAGDFLFSAAWTDMIKHTFVQFAGDDTVDLLGNPFFSTEFKSKVNASVNWTLGKFSTTVFADREGRTPNYLATLTSAGYGADGAGTLAPYTIVNLTFQYQLLSGLQLTAAIANVGNAMPPPDPTYPNYTEGPYNTANYQIIGRQYMVEATYKFTK